MNFHLLSFIIRFDSTKSNYIVRIECRVKTLDYYKDLTEDSIVAQYIYEEGKYQYINPAFAELFGYQREDFLNQSVSFKDLFDYNSYKYVKTRGMKHAVLKESYRLKGIKKDGNTIHVEIYSQILRESSTIMGTIIDITDQVKLKQELELSDQRYESFFRFNTDMIYSLDLDGTISSMNPAVERVTGYKPEEVIGKSFTPFIMVDDIGKTLYHFEEAKKGQTQHFDIRILNKDGDRVELSCASIPIIVNDEIIGVYGIGKDVTEQKKSEEKANYFAYYDPLTNLPNRRLFEDRLSQSFAYAKNDNDNMAVMFIDIDRFKLINDSFGHKTGDHLIQLIATRLKKQVRETDTVARLGGDEFTILLPDIKNDEEVLVIAERIIKVMEQPFNLEGKDFTTTTSVGISFSYSSEDHHTLIQQADLAMYHVKAHGRNAYACYSKEMDTKAAYRLNLENDLRRALELQELELHYQPIIEISTGNIRAVEALLRWNHPKLGLIPPLDFIPIAEEIGLICDIGEWVIKQACTQNKEWQDKELLKTRVAVNVSIKQLQEDDFYDVVKRILQETGLAPEWLSLEITESEMMKNHRLIVDTLTKIRNMGVKIFIDDFGTGYSSLSYLKQLPIDYVKIDKSFIKDIGLKNGEAIVKAILALTRQLDLKSVAEGVESEEQLAFLTKEYCEESQGYYISKPLAKNGIQSYIVAENSKLISKV